MLGDSASQYCHSIISRFSYPPTTRLTDKGNQAYLHISEVHVLQEPERNLHQGISWPRTEPIDLGAGDETGEPSTSRSERISDGGEAEKHMQVRSYPTSKYKPVTLQNDNLPQIMGFFNTHSRDTSHLCLTTLVTYYRHAARQMKGTWQMVGRFEVRLSGTPHCLCSRRNVPTYAHEIRFTW